MKPLRLVAVVAASLLAACSNASHGGQGGGPSPAATNPVNFPLFAGANVLSAHAWHDTVTARPGAADAAVFSEGAGTYDGHDVVAGTQAMMPALEAWLSDLAAHPPAGYSTAITGNGVDALRTHTRDLGVDFVAFQGTESGKRHGIVVLAVDPQTLDQKAGPMLGAIGKFKLLPRTLRDPLDAQAKKQTGFSITEATSPDTPIGAAIAALDQLRDFGGRGIVLIDAVKQ
ncbi:MAG: hypothetical protein WA814_02305 [Candidatus Baltobacteraceae bacterium]